MFENLLRKATITVKDTIQKEVADGAKVRINLGVKLLSAVFLIGAAVMTSRHSKNEPVEKEEDPPVPQQIIYNFYNSDGEKMFEFGKF